MFNVTISNKQLSLAQGRKDILRCSAIESNCTFDCTGVYGTVRTENSEYIVFITRAYNRGCIFDEKVFEIRNVRVVQVDGVYDIATANTLTAFFDLPGMYYSKHELYRSISFEKNNDTSFLFNFVPYMNFMKKYPQCEHLVVKCIQGYFNIFDCATYKLALISRRSWKHVGARYFSRGINCDGYASNFVETEQFLYNCMSPVASYLQIRGSLPVKWRHEISLRWSPKIVVEGTDLYKKSKDILKKMYGSFICLNLLKDKGYEKEICDEYKNLTTHDADAIHYDFFNKCILKDWLISKEFNSIAKYVVSETYDVDRKSQKSVVRVNCIDCLDRTNLCQYFIAQQLLKELLVQYSKDSDMLLDACKILWHENGNYLSRQYAGTDAIMANIIINDKNTILGIISDIVNSTRRYYINRFFDRNTNYAYDILTGKGYSKYHKMNIMGSLVKNYLNIVLLLVYFVHILMLRS